MKHKSPNKLTDEELESCIDGSTDLAMLRSILLDPAVLFDDNKVDVEEFAYLFQRKLSGFAENEEASDENYEWGLCIANNINEITTRKKS